MSTPMRRTRSPLRTRREGPRRCRAAESGDEFPAMHYNHLVRWQCTELDVWPKTVRYWRKRWRQAAEGQSVPERLADAPRSGAPATYTPEQICALVAMTCEKPSESERPISHWSQREIADEAMRRGLIANISQRSVGRFLKKRPTSSRIASATG